jgi:hypothetical protein
VGEKTSLSFFRKEGRLLELGLCLLLKRPVLGSLGLWLGRLRPRLKFERLQRSLQQTKAGETKRGTNKKEQTGTIALRLGRLQTNILNHTLKKEHWFLLREPYKPEAGTIKTETKDIQQKLLQTPLEAFKF